MTSLRELLHDGLFGTGKVLELVSMPDEDDVVDDIVDAVRDWLSQQETADTIYVAQTRTGIGPPLSAITAALLDLAAV